MKKQSLKKNKKFLHIIGFLATLIIPPLTFLFAGLQPELFYLNGIILLLIAMLIQMLVRSVKQRRILPDLGFFVAYYFGASIIYALTTNTVVDALGFSLAPFILLLFMHIAMIGYEGLLGNLGTIVAVIVHNLLILIPATYYLWIDSLSHKLSLETRNKIRRFLLIIILAMLLLGVHACTYGAAHFNI